MMVEAQDLQRFLTGYNSPFITILDEAPPSRDISRLTPPPQSEVCWGSGWLIYTSTNITNELTIYLKETREIL